MEVNHVQTVDLTHLAKLQGTEDNHCARMELISDVIYSFICAWDVAVVISESAYFRRFVQPYKVLLQVIEAIRVANSKYFQGQDIVLIDPTTVKTTLGVKGNLRDKDAIKAALQVLALTSSDLVIPEDMYLFYLDEHSNDSVAIGYAYFKWRKSCL